MSVITVDDYNKRLLKVLPLAAQLGIKATEFGDGEATLVMPYSPFLARPINVVSGPALMALADISMGAAVFTVYGPGFAVFTANLTINFLRKAESCDIIAHAKALKVGQRLTTIQAELVSVPKGDLIAHATASFATQPVESWDKT